MEKTCSWHAHDPLMKRYHDEEWGIPVHNDIKHFEFLILDAFQAGLSWKTILYKRENFREAFSGFDPVKVSKYSDARLEKLLLNPGIIRNRLKIFGARTNARAFLKVQKEFGTFDKFIWQFTHYKTIHNKWKTSKQIPATSSESDAMSRELKKRGFTFVGSTICYAYMQAAGMVNDHLLSCNCYAPLLKMRG